MSNAQKEYIVTLKNYNDLDQFYIDMEGESNLPHLPNRPVVCIYKRPVSRSTHYMLTDNEAKQLLNDSRVLLVNIKIKDLAVTNHLDQTATWSRGASLSPGQKNYGLYRCRIENNISGWGSDVGNTSQNSTIKITSTGKNVDIIVVDETVYPNHYELSPRAVQYDWFDNHDINVRGTATNLSFVSRSSNIATVTSQTAHGLNIGSIINIVCTSNNSFNSSSAEVIDIPSTTEFSYANNGTDVSNISATGYWKGTYQYGNYDYDNNHATHVAGILAGQTQGWARDSNIYNLRHNYSFTLPGSYCPPELLIDYIREFHSTKSINPQTGRKNPTLVNCSWGFSIPISNLNNPYTGFQYPRFSRLYYRGSFISPAASPVDTGFSGIYSSNAKIADLSNTQPSSGNRITTDLVDPAIGSVSSITFADTNKTGLTNIGAPTSFDSGGIDTQDDAYWNITLPFSISYLSQTYTNLYVNSNSYITFGNANFTYVMGDQSPALRKICVSAGDRNCDAVYTGTSGTTPNRIFTIRWEGYDGAYGSVYETSTNLVWEAKFYEATPNQIDIHVVTNACYRSEFTSQELVSYGLNLNSGYAPIRESSIDTDIADAINDGIIFVGSSGNSSTKIDVQGGLDYNNYYVDNGQYIYYHRGSTPSAASNVICVGNVDSSIQENKSENSNTGPRVDLYAPGNNIVSSVYDNTGVGSSTITENGSEYQKASGSSMSSAQVTGILALALETYPWMSQTDARNYILSYAKLDKIFDSQGSYTDSASLQNGNNKFAYYHRERPDDGVLLPKSRQWIRPSSGLLFPRSQIKKN